MTDRSFQFVSLSHMARTWDESPERVAEALLKGRANPPSFGYKRLVDKVRQSLVLNQDAQDLKEWIQFQANRNERLHYPELVPFIDESFLSRPRRFFVQVCLGDFRLDQGLSIPFEPLGLFGGEGEGLEISFPIFWKRNPIVKEAMALFYTVGSDLIRANP